MADGCRGVWWGSKGQCAMRRVTEHVVTKRRQRGLSCTRSAPEGRLK